MILEFKVTNIEWDTSDLSPNSPFDLTLLCQLPDTGVVAVAYNLSWTKPVKKVNRGKIRELIKARLEEGYKRKVLSFRTRLVKKED